MSLARTARGHQILSMDKPSSNDPERDLKGPVTPLVPDGDDRERMVCVDCGFIHYDNPRVVAGAVCTWQDKILLCKRAIAPRIGFWTIPSGYLELKETVADGAVREVLEESGAHVNVTGLVGMYEIPRISQIYIVYRAEMIGPDLDPGPESQDAALFAWDDIPWDDLAFSSVTWALHTYKSGAVPNFDVHTS